MNAYAQAVVSMHVQTAHGPRRTSARMLEQGGLGEQACALRYACGPSQARLMALRVWERSGAMG